MWLPLHIKWKKLWKLKTTDLNQKILDLDKQIRFAWFRFLNHDFYQPYSTGLSSRLQQWRRYAYAKKPKHLLFQSANFNWFETQVDTSQVSEISIVTKHKGLLMTTCP